ncbi:uncharacterized protein UBRO_20432 [Ustilago bromivora]|uniref:CCHC-type domain-containing protein n=1 Tax=Ustilago bromivora TaxID=307758 RepID=A0A1K0GZQ6_9BASI|nr:uncharacterized protein UBRO_20432 [Ustilago bromivora]
MADSSKNNNRRPLPQISPRLVVVAFYHRFRVSGARPLTADSMLSSIIMRSFSNKLRTKYFAEHGDRPVPIAIDLFDWAVKKCTVHSAAKEHELLATTYALHWDQRALSSDRNALFNSVFILHERLHGKEQTAESITDILHQCYELAAESAPVLLPPRSEASELTALRAATLINCWACGELGHAANRCPDDAAHAKWKQGRIKVHPKGHVNTCIVLPFKGDRDD